MTRANLQPKDALVLCTVSVLFIYFGLVLWTNYAIYVASVIKAVFHGYCYVIYIICDGRPRETNKEPFKADLNRSQATKEKDEAWEQGVNGNGTYHKRAPGYDLEGTQLDRIDEDDYELHPVYQILVDQEPDKYARVASWPSYINLFRAALIYILLQWTTPLDLWHFVKAQWSQVQFGTTAQLTYLILAIILHMQFVCMKQLVPMIEGFFYPNMSPEEQEERSILNTLPRMIRRTMQESLNSTLATVIVLSTLTALGFLGAIMSVGVAHDVQGLLSQTHSRVTFVKEQQLRQGLQSGYTTGYEPMARHPFVGQMDEALSQAYDAGVNWLDPILKEAFPDLAWGTADWAYHVANVVVDVHNDQDTVQMTKPKVVVVPAGACEADLKREPDLDELMHQAINQSPLSDDFITPSLSAEEKSADKEELKEQKKEEETVFEEPELWVIPTLEAFAVFGDKNQAAASGFLAPRQRRRAINISQVKYLLTLVSGYKGFDTNNMLWGFNAFNDLLFRWILFLLGLLTFTGLKVSPLKRVGWIIDQALTSHSSYGSNQLSLSASPGRVIAKSMEFAITGTFVSMLKLSIYHTIFTLVWTRFLTNQVMPLVTVGAASSDFVTVKYAWLTSLFGIILVLFPIAPNWLVSLPGGIIHFYVYGQRPMEAIAMVLGHIVMASMVDGAIWDSHVVKSARPTVSTAFWLGLWTFLGGMKWGPKGLLLGPVFFAAMPSIWSALLELRGRPTSREIASEKRPGVVRVSAEDEIRSRESRRRYRDDDQEEEVDEEYYVHRRRAGSTNKSRSRSTSRRINGHRH
ncbi:hypothetical protein EDD11_000858 [Mortierella claussenii]|nr:hypothetical protein EDD11_000858 [Mortierella claussenii]